MATHYQAIGWTRHKKIYDLVAIAGIALYLAVFAAANLLVHPHVTAETILIRGLGSCALLLLHVILVIGPLCRLDRRFLPLLYNRRHLGVITFFTGLGHASLSVIQFHSFGTLNPIISIFADNKHYAGIADFPFQTLGFFALAILFLMAATSHDFWLANLTPRVWKSLHMLVYVAYALLLLHVLLGVLLAETSPVLAALLGVGAVLVLGVHLTAGLGERKSDREAARRASEDGFVPICKVDEVAENRARTVCLSGERVAVFRYAGKLSAVSNVCRHQLGPLGEGKIVDGCITCPWHGYQYLPESGASPPPFEEKVETYRVRLIGRQVFVDPRPNPPGTPVPPALIPEEMESGNSANDALYVGYLPHMPAANKAAVRLSVLLLAVVAAALPVVLTTAQHAFAPSTFEFGTVREFRGILKADPYPVLLVPRPDASSDSSPYYLVLFGKHGAQSAARPLLGREVMLRGELIYREGQTMVQVEEGSIREAPSRSLSDSSTTQDLGTMTLRGEIVDSKCYLGVMKPGSGKPHRSCASLCIRGGIPPVFLVRDKQGHAAYFLLVSPQGEALNQQVLPWVAEPLEITGQVVRRENLLLLKANHANFRRLRE